MNCIKVYDFVTVVTNDDPTASAEMEVMHNRDRKRKAAPKW